jgi:predicted transcriptional regulator
LINDQIACSNELTGLEVAKYLLSKLVKDHGGIEKMTEALDCDYDLVSELLEFFIDTGWIKQNANQTYEIIKKGKKRIEEVKFDQELFMYLDLFVAPLCKIG